jgi:hypothetical protein
VKLALAWVELELGEERSGCGRSAAVWSGCVWCRVHGVIHEVFNFYSLRSKFFEHAVAALEALRACTHYERSKGLCLTRLPAYSYIARLAA